MESQGEVFQHLSHFFCSMFCAFASRTPPNAEEAGQKWPASSAVLPRSWATLSQKSVSGPVGLRGSSGESVATALSDGVYVLLTDCC